MSDSEEQQVVQTPQARLKSLITNKKKLIMLSVLVLLVAIAVYFFIIKKKKLPTEIPTEQIVA